MSVFDGLPAVFVDTFGQAVTVKPGGWIMKINAVFKRRGERDGFSDGGAVVMETYLLARTADVADMAYDDEVIVGDECFRAGAPEPDSRGMTRIPLRAAP